MTEQSSTTGPCLPIAGLALRLAAMLYEVVLIFSVVFAVSYALLASMHWSYPLPPIPRAVLQTALFGALGAYFVVCWTRTGQTLALKAWRLKVVDSGGQLPHRSQAIARYVLAWHLWLPGLAIAGLLRSNVGWTLAALAVTFAVLMIPALIDHQRRLLHDRWTGTRVVRVPGP